MCGIAGIIGNRASKVLVEKMLESQHHRGPDNSNTYIENDLVALGHNRLAILDLHSRSNQPFSDATKRYHIVFNGEIYNYIEIRKSIENMYSFRTQSDTEVLLALYLLEGEQCLQRLNGMFSFAIWDSLKKELFAARDRFGVKPFYYILSDQLIFASEIKALFEAGISKQPHQSLWSDYFIRGSYGFPEETFWDGVHQLPSGHYLKYAEKKVTITKWYDFEAAIKAQPIPSSYDQAKDYYLELLIDSIKLRFRSDVKVGFNLSGGLDSSALLALVNETQKNTGDIEAFYILLQ